MSCLLLKQRFYFGCAFPINKTVYCKRHKYLIRFTRILYKTIVSIKHFNNNAFVIVQSLEINLILLVIYRVLFPIVQELDFNLNFDLTMNMDCISITEKFWRLLAFYHWMRDLRTLPIAYFLKMSALLCSYFIVERKRINSL